MATYTDQQLSRFHHRIGMPQRLRVGDVRKLTSHEQLDLVTSLMQRFLLHIPFENLSLHYSQQKGVSIDEHAVFGKMCGLDPDKTVPLGRGRGGYCMENNQLFGTALRSMGFTVYAVGARVYGSSSLEGFGHMINLVQIGDHLYSVDVGFGGNGPIRPLKLPHEEAGTDTDQPIGQPVPNDPGTEVRLVWADAHEVDAARLAKDYDRVNNPPLSADTTYGKNIMSTRPQFNSWIYQTRRLDGQDANWEPMYAFVTQHFSANDYKVMNHFTSTSPATFFTHKVMCVRKLGAHELADAQNPVRRALEAQAQRNEHVQKDGTGRTPIATVNKAVEGYARTSDDGEVHLVGQVILFDKSLKIRIANDNFTIVEMFKSEDERCDALQQYFNIQLQPHERRGIKGMASAI